MLIIIETETQKFFRQYLELLRNNKPLNSLRNRELDLLSEIMYQMFKYRKLDEDGALNQFVFSNGMRKKMRENIVMNEATFNNNLSIIRKNGIIKEDWSLVPFLNINPKDGLDVIFRFIILDHEDSNSE